MKPYLLLLLLACSFSLTAQSNLDDFTYTSEQEKTYLQQIDSVDIFHLFYSVEYEEYDNSEAILKSFHTFLDELKRSQKTTTPKGMLKSFRAIHGMYLSKYETNPRFYEIFREGIYNCVTATALYAIAFDYLGIPYQIMKTPVHVYLVAESRYGEIIIESTMPQGGFFMLSDKSVKELKRYLLSSKIITHTEASNLSNKDFVHDFYLSDTKISLKELLAILYYNRAIYEGVENQDAQKTLMHLEKAHYIAESDEMAEMINLTYEKMLFDNELGISSFTKYLKKYYLFPDRTAEDAIVGYANISMLEKLLKSQQFDKIDTLITALTNYSTNINFFKRIRNEVYYTLAKYHVSSLANDKALSYLKLVDFGLLPDAKLITLSLVSKQFSNVTSPVKGLDSLAKYEATFPFLKTDAHIQGYGVWCYMKLMHKYFTQNNEAKGLEYYQLFKQKYQPDTKANKNDGIIGHGFGAASAYYVKVSNYSQAKTLLHEGLQYDTDNAQLIRKLQVLTNHER